MRKGFPFILHYAIILTFSIVSVVILAVQGIESEALFIVFNATFCIAHPFIYLIIGTYKEYKYHNYKMPKYMIIALVTNCVVGVVALYVFFKLEDNHFEDLWWVYDLTVLLGLILPIVIGYIINKIKPEKTIGGPRIIRNK